MNIKIKCNDSITLEVNIDIFDYYSWRQSKDYKTDEHLMQILNTYLKDLDVSKKYIYGEVNMTKTPRYTYNIELYCKYLVKFSNQLYYNAYLDKLIKQHLNNIEYEEETKEEKGRKDNRSNKRNTNKHDSILKVSKRRVNKFHKLVTTDISTGKEKFIYVNEKTQEKVESDNPNLLEELNVRKTKHNPVPLSAMTFSFKKK